MSLESVRVYLRQYGLDDKILVEKDSTATVQLAAEALGVQAGRIAKSMAFQDKEEGKAIIIVTAGTAKIANGPFKKTFGFKAHMLDAETLLHITGHPQGGVCPFALDEQTTRVFLDESLRNYPTVFPACGSSDSCIELTISQLMETSKAQGWVDVCKKPEN